MLLLLQKLRFFYVLAFVALLAVGSPLAFAEGELALRGGSSVWQASSIGTTIGGSALWGLDTQASSDSLEKRGLAGLSIDGQFWGGGAAIITPAFEFEFRDFARAMGWRFGVKIGEVTGNGPSITPDIAHVHGIFFAPMLGYSTPFMSKLEIGVETSYEVFPKVGPTDPDGGVNRYAILIGATLRWLRTSADPDAQ